MPLQTSCLSDICVFLKEFMIKATLIRKCLLWLTISRDQFMTIVAWIMAASKQACVGAVTECLCSYSKVRGRENCLDMGWGLKTSRPVPSYTSPLRPNPSKKILPIFTKSLNVWTHGGIIIQTLTPSSF